MKLVTTLPLGRDEADVFQHGEMLRDRLACQSEPVFHRQPGAELEQRLAVALLQFVENCATRGRGQCFEDVTHCWPL